MNLLKNFKGKRNKRNDFGRRYRRYCNYL